MAFCKCILLDIVNINLYAKNQNIIKGSRVNGHVHLMSMEKNFDLGFASAVENGI